jgi:hypothetical protein
MREERVHPAHRSVADDLCHDRGCRDRRAPFVPVDDGQMIRSRRAKPEPVDEAGLGRRRERA